jgi:hypothetical protein
VTITGINRIAELPPEELAARNEELAATTQDLRRFQAIVEGLAEKA